MTGVAQVVARRWDGIGGRLNALANASALASAHGLDLRFAWPDTPEVASGDPAELFSRDFLDAHLVESVSLDRRPGIGCDDVQRALECRRELLADGCDGDPFLDVDPPFDAHPGLGHGADATAALAAAFGGIRWADALAPVVEHCTRWPAAGERWTGIHVRAGDVVTGAWRRTLWHEKYQVLPLLRSTVERSCQDGGTVLLVTDHPALADWLAAGLSGACRPAALIAEYPGLTESQQVLADLLLLSRCSSVVGPPKSALSGLAAALGGVEVAQPVDLFDPEERRTLLEAGIAAQFADRAHPTLLAPVTARDIVWYADVYGGSLPARRLTGLLEAATELDPAFCGAWARLGRTRARQGRWRDARRAARAAVTCAAADERQDDTAFEAALTDAVVGSLSTLRKAWRPGRAARRRELDRVRASIAAARTLRPWHPLAGALTASEELATRVATVVEAPWTRRVGAAGALRRRLAPPLDPGSDRGRLAQVRTGAFDWMRPEIEALVRRCAGDPGAHDRSGHDAGPSPTAPYRGRPCRTATEVPRRSATRS